MGAMLMMAGYLVLVVGGLWMVIVAFQESVLWGIGCMVLPFLGLVFLFMYWQQAKRPFFLQLAGMALVLVGIVLGGTSGVTPAPQ
jgi:hypothetical protein